ncbi:MAG: dihydroxy 2-butanone 4-phosphate synthase / GTP cyclohydrolase II [Candidatus Tokpelaia sp. JSC085]|nr:MAG: dihydroxy 2-butanone 4-phosphate synthase / GTP cyclohydrolase II [Candidatus Tokpelaia sp. JSC085]
MGNNTVEAIRAFERGEIIVVMDDNGRENEGDLIIAAVHCTSVKMAFIVRYTSGIVCAAIPHEEAKRLHLAPMVSDNDSLHSTTFTVTVDYRYGTTTGISADDRTLTVRNLANPHAVPTDFVRPGHIFPLIAREGGVLTRSGHTEAAVDLCRLAKLPPVGVLCELINDDGTVMRGSQVSAFAKRNNLHQVTVANLIAYRQHKEQLIEHLAEISVKTMIGFVVAHIYQLPWESIQHIALIIGDIHSGENIPVHLYYENVFNDIFWKAHHLDQMLKWIKEEHKRGVLIYLREGSICVTKKEGSKNTCTHKNQENHAEAVIREQQWRKIGLGAQILKHLGLHSIVLLASKERSYVGLERFGIRIARTEVCHFSRTTPTK